VIENFSPKGVMDRFVWAPERIGFDCQARTFLVVRMPAFGE